MHCLSLITTDTTGTLLGLLYLIPQTAPATKHLLWFLLCLKYIRHNEAKCDLTVALILIGISAT